MLLFNSWLVRYQVSQFLISPKNLLINWVTRVTQIRWSDPKMHDSRVPVLGICFTGKGLIPVQLIQSNTGRTFSGIRNDLTTKPVNMPFPVLTGGVRIFKKFGILKFQRKFENFSCSLHFNSVAKSSDLIKG